MRFFSLLFLFLSTSAFSATYEYYQSGSYALPSCFGVSIGDIFDPNSGVCSVGKTFWNNNHTHRYEIVSISVTSSSVVTTYTSDGSRTYVGTMYVRPASCRDGDMYNPATGKCESAPSCESGSVYDFGSESCVDDPDDDFCSGAFTEAYNGCYDSNGIFDQIAWQCDEATHNYSSSCDTSNSDKCYFGQPSYPDCLGNNSDDIQGPDSGYDPNSPDPINPESGYDKSEPDPVTPNETTDTGVLQAVQNMNRDLNNANTQLNSDMNTGFAALQNAANQTNANLDALGQILENSVGQDAQARREAAEFYGENLSALSSLGANMTGVRDSVDNLNSTVSDLPAQLNGSVNSSQCTTFDCDGNAAACYLAYQKWKDDCESGSSLASAGTEMQGLVNDMQGIAEGYVDEDGVMKGIYTESESTMEDMLSAYDTDNGFHFSSGCPQPREYDVVVAKFTIDYAAFCQLALVFRALLMASAALGSLFMFARYM